jgi:hypothetical protein
MWQPGGQGLLLVLRLVTNLPSPSQTEVPKQYTYTATAIAAMACLSVSTAQPPDARALSRLHWAAVRRHIRVSAYKENHVEARPGDVMAGAGGAAGPAQEVCHQPPATTIYIYIYIYYNYVLYQNNAAGIAVKASIYYARGLGFETRQLHIFAFCIFLCTYKHELVHSMYVPSIYIL